MQQGTQQQQHTTLYMKQIAPNKNTEKKVVTELLHQVSQSGIDYQKVTNESITVLSR